MHDIVNGKSPLHITTLFTNVCDVHTVITQEQQLVKICINPELDLMTSKSLSTMGMKIWNCLPLSICNLSNQHLKRNVSECC